MIASLVSAAPEVPVAQGRPANLPQPGAADTLPVVARRPVPPGRLRKQLRVPDRHVAIVLAATGPYTLGPGDHSLANWPAPAPEVILADIGPLPLDLQWDALPAGDGEPVTLTASLQVTVADPLRLYETWLRTSTGPEWPLPADAVAGRLHEPVSQWAARYAAADLNRRPAQDDLVQELRKLLAPELARYGLVPATPALTIRCLTQTNREALAEAARRSRELALDARMADALAQLETRDMFLDQMAAWGERTGEPLDNATLEMLWQRVAPDGLPLHRAEAVSASLAQGAVEMEAAAAAATPLPTERRFDQQLARLGAPVATLPDTPSDTLNRLYRGLRLGAATVGVAWALRAVFSHGFDPNNLAGLLLEGLGLVVAVVGVAAAAVTYRQVQSQAAPYWKVIQDQIAGLPAGVKLAAARARARRINLAADALILVALVAGLLLWLGRQPRALLALPVLAFMLAFALVLAARRGEQAARRQVDALIAQVVRPTLPERRTADDLLRRRVREYLERAQTNLAEAQNKLYTELVAVTIRQCRDSLKKAQEETQKVHYWDAQYFANVWVPDEQVTRMLELDDDLLRRAQKLASGAKDLNKASGASVPDIPACDEATRVLCNEVIEFRDVLSERSAFIGGIDK